MTDTSHNPGQNSGQSTGATAFGDDRTAARLKKRRRAEWRLKAYGIAAISVAGLALIALLSSVVTKAGGALTESYLTLPVVLDPAVIDPQEAKDPKKILRADFGGLTKAALRDEFPWVKARGAKRELYDLVSNGASFELAQKVSDDPSLVGQTLDYRFLASDISDLYLQGSYGSLVQARTKGSLSIVDEGKTVKITSTADDFAPILEVVKRGLVGQAAFERRQAALQDNGVRAFAARLEAATTDEDKAAAQAEVTARSAKRDAFLAEAADLEARAKGAGGSEDLTTSTPSLLIQTAGGWIKLTRVEKSSAQGIVMAPTDGAVTDSQNWTLYSSSVPEASRKVSDDQIVWLEVLRDQGRIDTVFNTRFFTAGDSREPELAGIWGAAVGSFWTMLVTFCLAFPIGVLAAIYLEEFAPKRRLTDFIEVNINNLAAVPSIVFGLLGLAVFLGFFGVPRSAPLAGGIVLALMTLPTIIIASRAAIRAVPPSIREAALGVGASKLQSTFHHVLPLAMPGILTGTIIGMAQALGETAPLIMIGMVAFIVDIPTGVLDSATVLPVQVYRWSDFPERAFEARTAAAILVLLGFLVIMNALAVFLRKRFERRW